VQYWENWEGDNVVHARPAREIQDNYPKQVAAWERKLGASWTARYPRGNFFTPKRGFENTPSKPKPKEKKSRVFDLEDDDIEMMDPSPPRGHRRARPAHTGSASCEVAMAPLPRPRMSGLLEPVRSRSGASHSHPETPSASGMAVERAVSPVTPSDRSMLSESDESAAFSRSTAASSVGSMSNSAQGVSRGMRAVENLARARSMLDPISPTRPDGSRWRSLPSLAPIFQPAASADEEEPPAANRLGVMGGSPNIAPRVFREPRMRRRPQEPSGDMDGLE
jgi:hypothetical protein